LIFNGLLLVLELGLLLMMYRGHVQLASTLLTLVLWLYFTFVAVIFGGSRSPGILGYILVILVAGLLLGGKAAMGFAGITIVAGMGLLYTEINDLLPSALVTITPVYYWTAIVTATIITAILLHLANSSIENALAQARQEIGERKQAERALRRSEERLRAVISNAPLILWTLNRHGAFTMVEGRGFEGTVLDAEQLVGSSIFESFADTPQIKENFERALAGETAVFTLEVGEATLESRFSPLQSEEEEITGIIGVSIDISERKRTEEALRQAQKLESLGLLAGGIAHDFNNLLVAMMGQTSLALSKLSPENPARPHIEKANRTTERAADLTRQLLAYSGRGQFDVRPLNLNTLIQENLHLFQVAIPKHIHLQTRTADSLPAVEADLGQMQQVIMNLILNAAEAIDEQPGTITIVTDRQTVTADDTYWQNTGTPLEPGHYVTLEVHDTGNGMDADTMTQIFDPFYTTKATGRGLGLAAVLGVVQGHGGGIRVYSEVGQGTTFKLLFPATDATATTPASPPTRPAADSVEGLVLVIDDEEAVREAVTDILELHGLDVVTAADGQTGIELFRQRSQEISLVLLDLSMPGLSGQETFRALRGIDPTVPVILSSGYNEHEATRRFVGKGLAGFLQKPYNLEGLVEKIQQYL
jgi:PAS domain S-box-containing protein